MKCYLGPRSRDPRESGFDHVFAVLRTDGFAHVLRPSTQAHEPTIVRSQGSVWGASATTCSAIERGVSYALRRTQSNSPGRDSEITCEGGGGAPRHWIDYVFARTSRHLVKQRPFAATVLSAFVYQLLYAALACVALREAHALLEISWTTQHEVRALRRERTNRMTIGVMKSWAGVRMPIRADGDDV